MSVKKVSGTMDFAEMCVTGSKIKSCENFIYNSSFFLSSLYDIIRFGGKLYGTEQTI